MDVSHNPLVAFVGRPATATRFCFVRYYTRKLSVKMERVNGIAPSPWTWQAHVLLLNYTRKSIQPSPVTITGRPALWAVPSKRCPSRLAEIAGVCWT